MLIHIFNADNSFEIAYKIFVTPPLEFSVFSYCCQEKREAIQQKTEEPTKSTKILNIDVTDMTSFCRKRTEVTFDKSLRTQNTIIQNTHNQRKLIYLI